MTVTNDQRNAWGLSLVADRDLEKLETTKEERKVAKQSEFSGKSLRIYMQTLAKYPPLMHEEQRALLSEFNRLRSLLWANALQTPTGLTFYQNLMAKGMTSRRDNMHGAFGLDYKITAETVQSEMDWLLNVLLTDTAQDCYQRFYEVASKCTPESHEATNILKAELPRLSDERAVTVRALLTDLEIVQMSLVNCNLRLAFSRVGKFLHHGVASEDLIQDGTLGLLKSIERFDITKPFKFSTYAVFWIEQCMIKSLTSMGRTVRLPTGIISRIVKVNKNVHSFRRTHGRDPSRAELAEACQLTEQDVDSSLLIARGALKPDNTVTTEDGDVVDIDFVDIEATTSEEKAESANISELVRRMICKLPPVEQIVLRLYYGIGLEGSENIPEHSLAIISQMKDIHSNGHTVSKQRVEQILTKAKNRLKSTIEAYHLTEEME